MPPRSRTLTAVKDGETAPKPEPKPAARRRRSVATAASSGDRLELMYALRDRIARTVNDPKCPPRDLAALTRRLMDLAEEIETLEASNREDEINDAAATPDEPWDSEAI